MAKQKTVGQKKLTRGRKLAKFTNDDLELIINMLGNGNTDRQIIEQLPFNKDTFYRLKREDKEFLDAYKKGEDLKRQNLRQIAESSLFKKVSGYTVTEVTKEYMVPKDDQGKEIEGLEPTLKYVKESEKYIAPSDTLIQYSLNNTDPENWKHKDHVKVEGSITQTNITQMSTEELKERAKAAKTIEDSEK